MKKILTALLLFSLLHTISAQTSPDFKRDYQWVFGYFYETNGIVLDFNTKPAIQKPMLKKLTPDLNININEICDTSGQFFCVENGCKIYNKNFDILQNSEKLNPGIYTEKLFCKKSGTRHFQASIMLPSPEDDTLIYLFHKIEDIKDLNNPYWFCDTLRLTIINTKGDNGNGAVIVKNKPIFADTMLREQMTAVRHANGKDWWLINPLWNKNYSDNRFVLHLITKDSIKEPFIQSIGKTIETDSKVYPQVGFSPDGTKFFRYYNTLGLYYYHFDREKGLLSDFKFLDFKHNTLEFDGAEFSPNSRFLYMSGVDKIFQLDTEAEDWNTAIDTVAIWNGFIKNGFKPSFSYMKLAPDCKIYVFPTGTTPYIGVINYPNQKGTACKVEQQIKLISHTSQGPPNYPNYRLGKLGENIAPCDSTINPFIKGMSIGTIDVEQPIIANLYPNPAIDVINLDLFGYINQYKKGIFNLYDTQGKIAATYPLLQNHDEYRFDISNLPNGMYFWNLVLDDKIRQTGKVVVMKE